MDVTRWFDAFRDWAILNRTTSPLFVYFLTPIGDFATQVVTNTILLLERMTWLGLVVTAAAISGLVAGWKMAVLAGAGVLSFGLLGVWDAAIETMALMLVAVVLALLIGIPLGIWAGRRPRVERVLRPILDAMQTIPAYSYLLPFVLLFGIGDAPALMATLAFALPPAIRLTALGIRSVPGSSLEVADAFGSTDRQKLRLVQVPLAKPSIMLGVNQTIMMALGIVVIAAFVGAGGLGQTVLDGLQRLSVGSALNGGVAIVIMAVVLDRVTTAWSLRERRRVRPPHSENYELSRRQLTIIAAAAIVAAVLIGRQVLRQQGFPEGLVLARRTHGHLRGLAAGDVRELTSAMSDFILDICWIRSRICSRVCPGG